MEAALGEAPAGLDGRVEAAAVADVLQRREKVLHGFDRGGGGVRPGAVVEENGLVKAAFDLSRYQSQELLVVLLVSARRQVPDALGEGVADGAVGRDQLLLRVEVVLVRAVLEAPRLRLHLLAAEAALVDVDDGLVPHQQVAEGDGEGLPLRREHRVVLLHVPVHLFGLAEAHAVIVVEPAEAAVVDVDAPHPPDDLPPLPERERRPLLQQLRRQQRLPHPGRQLFELEAALQHPVAVASGHEGRDDVPDGAHGRPELAGDLAVAHRHPAEVGDGAEAVKDDALSKPQVDLTVRRPAQLSRRRLPRLAHSGDALSKQGVLQQLLRPQPVPSSQSVVAAERHSLVQRAHLFAANFGRI